MEWLPGNSCYYNKDYIILCSFSIETALEIEEEATNFAIRLFSGKHLFIHFDTPKGSSFLCIENITTRVKTAFTVPPNGLDEAVGIGLADVICPICLENYENPKILNCGHSLCQTHLNDLSAKGEKEFLHSKSLRTLQKQILM